MQVMDAMGALTGNLSVRDRCTLSWSLLIQNLVKVLCLPIYSAKGLS